MNDPTVQMMNQHQHQQQQQQQQQHPPPSQQQQMMNNVNQNLPPMMNQPQPQMMMMNQPPTLASTASSQMMNRSYGIWVPPPQMVHPNPNPNAPLGGGAGGFGSGKVKKQMGLKNLGPRNNWKGKRVKDGRRKDNIGMALAGGSSGGGVIGGAGGGYQPPTLNELQHQNRVKAKRFFSKKKYNPHYHTNFNNNNNNNNNGGRNMGKFAPRNTTSFLIRAKKSGGIAELVSPYPVTPAVLPTPMFSPSREVLVDMAKEEWGVDGYGSMKGLIRLRSPGREDEGDDDEDEGESSESDVEDHVEVERRLDHDLSRFEMIYPNNAGGMDYHNVLENRVDDQDTHIAHLEEENLILKERLFLMDRELGDLRRRLRYLERHNHGGGEDIHEEVLENESDSETESRGESRLERINLEEFVEENTEGHRDVKMGEEFEGELKLAKGNDENVKVKDEADVGNSQEGVIVKGLKNAAGATLDNSMELESKIDTANDEREVSNSNVQSVTEKFNPASGLMNETPGNDVQIKDKTPVSELGTTSDAGLDILSMGGEKKDEAGNDAIPEDKASDE